MLVKSANPPSPKQRQDRSDAECFLEPGARLSGNGVHRVDDLQDPAHITLFPIGLGTCRVGVMAMDTTRTHEIRGRIPERDSAAELFETIKRLVWILGQELPCFSSKLILQAALPWPPGKRICAVEARFGRFTMSTDALPQFHAQRRRKRDGSRLSCVVVSHLDPVFSNDLHHLARVQCPELRERQSEELGIAYGHRFNELRLETRNMPHHRRHSATEQDRQHQDRSLIQHLHTTGVSSLQLLQHTREETATHHEPHSDSRGCRTSMRGQGVILRWSVPIRVRMLCEA